MALTNGPNLGLLVDGEQGEAHYQQLMAQWRGLDALVQSAVVSVINDPPVSPADGVVYIVGDTPTGAWVDHENDVARWSGKEEAWEFYTPKAGWLVHDADTSRPLWFDGSDWLPLNAQMIHVVDAGGNFAGDTLEEVLAEIGSRLLALEGEVT